MRMRMRRRRRMKMTMKLEAVVVAALVIHLMEEKPRVQPHAVPSKGPGISNQGWTHSWPDLSEG